MDLIVEAQVGEVRAQLRGRSRPLGRRANRYVVRGREVEPDDAAGKVRAAAVYVLGGQLSLADAVRPADRDGATGCEGGRNPLDVL